jgi:L-fucose mutarotase
VVGDAAALPEVVQAFLAEARRAEGHEVRHDVLPRDQFYARARQAFAVVQTGEMRLYGNVLLRKGVLRQAGTPT